MKIKALFGALAITSAALAEPPETYDVALVTGDAAAEIAEMTELFGKVCIDHFPDDAMVAKEMIARGGVAMTPADVEVLLHADQGVGWKLVGKTTTYYVTVEAAPWHACAVRAATREGFADMTPFNALKTKFQSSWSNVQHVPQQSTVRGALQIDANADLWRMPDGKTETIMVYTTRVADPTLAVGHAGVEVRFVRQQVTPAAGSV
jgi:hypothetical protein